ncbi:MAG: hypothetical protein ACOX4L_05950 [Bacillota bacterium]
MLDNSLIIIIGVFIVLGILSFVVRKTLKWVIYISLAAFAIFYFSTGGDLNKAINQTLQFDKRGGHYVVNTASNYIKENVKATIESNNNRGVAKIEYLDYTIINVIGTKEYKLYKEGRLIKNIKLNEVITIDKDSETVNLPDKLIKFIDKQ